MTIISADSSANAPDGDGKFLARIDVTRDTKINIDGNYTLSTQYQSSPNLYNNGLLDRAGVAPARRDLWRRPRASARTSTGSR